MISAPGLQRWDSAPPWLAKVQIIELTGWTEDKYDRCSLETRRQLLTYLRGVARGYEQRERKQRIADKRSRQRDF